MAVFKERYTDEQRDKFIEGIKAGMSNYAAAEDAGVSPATAGTWGAKFRRDPDAWYAGERARKSKRDALEAKGVEIVYPEPEPIPTPKSVRKPVRKTARKTQRKPPSKERAAPSTISVKEFRDVKETLHEVLTELQGIRQQLSDGIKLRPSTISSYNGNGNGTGKQSRNEPPPSLLSEEPPRPDEEALPDNWLDFVDDIAECHYDSLTRKAIAEELNHEITTKQIALIMKTAEFRKAVAEVEFAERGI